MAKNYSVTEMVNVLVEGNDLEAIAEMGKRFPVLTYKITKVTSKAAEEFADLAKYLDFVSANRVTKLIKGDSVDEDETVVESEVDADETEAEEEPEKKELTKAEKAKARREARKAKKAREAAEAAEDAEADESEDEADDGNIYSDMTAIELFKECKKRKIKAAVPKKPQAFYIDLLKKDDAKKTKEAAAEAEDEDEWDAEEEQEEKKPAAKKTRRPKATVKKAKAPAPEVEAEEDDDEDDDWDI